MAATNEWLQRQDSEFLAVLRSLSILTIVFGHVGGYWFFPPWSELLHVFVPVFFFISGAVSYNGFVNRVNTSQYLLKRIVRLLVPYYCMCAIALAVFALQHGKLPEFDFGKLIQWLMVIPSNAIMPFPMGQVWFLETLTIISLVSPAIFLLYKLYPLILYVLLCGAVVIAGVQTTWNIAPSLGIAGHNFFRPIVHLLFFCTGFLVVDLPKLRSARVSMAIILLCLAMSVGLAKGLKLNPDYAEHIIYPDLYFVLGSFCAIWLCITVQSYVVKIYDLSESFRAVSKFLFRHTFAIFLLHTFAIYCVEMVFGLSNPQEKTVAYGLVKLLLVLLVTLLLSPFFTRVSYLIESQALGAGGPVRPSTKPF